ncbi:MAG: PorP/SprF family type IX secretion system membrane protein [Putridiphycobacter sp.]|nr:PorP/SprF family type IX secretion system membrane protein [Putridiphycobacter sp.]
MKNQMLTWVLVFLSAQIFGQQQAHFTQFQYNQFALNPALAGDKKGIAIKAGYRFQWIGLEGAPQSGHFSFCTPLKFNKRGRSVNAPKHGVGVQLNSDSFGPWSNSQIHLTYAIKVTLKRDVTLAYGLSTGLKQVGFDAFSVNTLNPDLTVFNAQSSIVFPDARIGTWLNLKNAYFGLSIHNLFGGKMKRIGQGNRFQQHLYFTYGQRFKMDQDWYVVPSILFVKTKAMPFDFHLSVIVDYQNKFSFGVGFRRSDAVTMQVRFKISDLFSIGYSFDYTISKLQNNSWQSQELAGSYNSVNNSQTFGQARATLYE